MKRTWILMGGALLCLLLCVLLPMTEARADTEIASVSVTIAAPAGGASPSYNAVLPSGVHYELNNLNTSEISNGVLWEDLTNNTFLVVATDKIVVGNEYKV